MSPVAFAQVQSVLVTVLNWLWTLIVLGVATYLVFWRGYSGWWYALAVFLDMAGQMSIKGRKHANDP